MMKTKGVLAISVGLALMCCCWVGWAAAAVDTNLVTCACSQDKVSANSDYWRNVNAVLAEVEKAAPEADNYDYATNTNINQLKSSDDVAYAKGSCDRSLSKSGCSDCLSTLTRRFQSMCGTSLSASAQLASCSARYDRKAF
eukprot:Gb_38429 [translate_table: standard]